MADPQMEQLAEADRVFREAGLQFDEAWKALGQTATAEIESATARERTYGDILRQGFVIGKIILPQEVWYYAGEASEHVGGLFGGTEHKPAFIPIDANHAKTLEGSFANVRVVTSHTGTRYPRNASQHPAPQGGFNLVFTVEGRRANAVLPESVFEPEYDGVTNTTYDGPLAAIEWRLPTPDEVARYSAQTEIMANQQ